jgi:hypothetical protein
MKFIGEIGKGHDAEVFQGIAGKDRLAVEAEPIPTGYMTLGPVPLSQIVIGGCEVGMEVQFPPQLAGHVAVPRAGHAPIHLGEKVKIRIAKIRVIFQNG